MTSHSKRSAALHSGISLLTSATVSEYRLGRSMAKYTGGREFRNVRASPARVMRPALHLPGSQGSCSLLLRLPMTRLLCLINFNSVMASTANRNKVKERFSALSLGAAATEFIALIAE